METNFSRDKFIKESHSDRDGGEQLAAIKELNETMASFGPANKFTESNLKRRLTPEKLAKRGFGNRSIKDWRDTSEYATNEYDGIRFKIQAVFELTWQDRRPYEESVRVHFMDEIRDSDLTADQQAELIQKLDGHFHIANMRLNYDWCGGDIAMWVATQEKGGMVSVVEADRLSFVHFVDQIKENPPLARVMEELDDKLIEFIGSKNAIVDGQITPVTLDLLINTIDLSACGLGQAESWKKNYIKELALTWYKVLGFPDIRKYGYRSQVYREKMPRGKEVDRRREKEVKQYNDTVNHESASIGLSPYYFLMDPNALMARILNKYANIIDGIETRTVHSNSGHQIFTLGYRPPAWFFMDKMNKTADNPEGKPIPPLEINNHSLKKLGLAKISDTQWQAFIKDGGDKLISDQAFKYAEKAIAARGAFYGCLNAEPDKFGALYVAVADFLRKNEEAGNLFTKAEIFPIVTDALVAIADWLFEEGKSRLPIEEYKFRAIMASVKGIVSPVDPFRGSDYEKLIKRTIPARGIL